MKPFDPSVLELLRCPVTHSALREMSAIELEKLNDSIRGGNVKDRQGNAVADEFKSGLINADQSIGWSIRGGIMQLIADEGIDLNGSA